MLGLPGWLLVTSDDPAEVAMLGHMLERARELDAQRMQNFADVVGNAVARRFSGRRGGR